LRREEDALNQQLTGQRPAARRIAGSSHIQPVIPGELDASIARALSTGWLDHLLCVSIRQDADGLADSAISSIFTLSALLAAQVPRGTTLSLMPKARLSISD